MMTFNFINQIDSIINLKGKKQIMKSQTPTVMFTTDDYVMPDWAGVPKYQFHFQVIKDGCIISTIPIKRKQFSLIGRLADLCDIFIDNPTVSRKHAILQFDKRQPLPLLYDLGTSHGTYVNKQKLPPKAFKKLELFCNVKLGVSSRSYVLRCPQLEKKMAEQEQQRQSEFVKAINQQNKILSKQQLKKKYLQLLQKDPYFGGQLQSRKFQGEAKGGSQKIQQKYQGISWGISDEAEVYAYKNDRDFSIEPDVLRRLPGLDSTMLDKLADYEEKFRQYDQIESQLNQLANQEKKQYGLQQKLQTRKQKLQKRFVQSLQALQRSQGWIRMNFFGEQQFQVHNKNKKKEKQKDTFSDDEFYDRTLADKKNKETGGQVKQVKRNQQKQQVMVEDLWQIKGQFIDLLKRKKEILKDKQNRQTDHMIVQETQTTEPAQTNLQGNLQNLNQRTQQDDQFQLFMKQNQQNLQAENRSIFQREFTSIQEKLYSLRQKLLIFLSDKQISKLQQQTLNPQLVQQKQAKKQKKQAKQREHLQSTLQLLQKQQKLRLQNIKRKEQIQRIARQNQYSQKLFDLYKDEYKQQLKQQVSDEDQGDYAVEDLIDRRIQNEKKIVRSYERNKNQQFNEEARYIRNQPHKKVHINEEQQYPVHSLDHQEQEQQKNSQQQVIDLTSKYNS